MNVRTGLWLSALGVYTGCLVGGYALTGRLPGAGLALGLLVGWLLARRLRNADYLALALGASICLAGAGLWLRAAPDLMLVGAVAALAAWDLGQLDLQLSTSSHPAQAGRLEARHYPSLALALGLGLAIVLLGRGLRLQVAFIPMVLAAAAALVCLGQVSRRLR